MSNKKKSRIEISRRKFLGHTALAGVGIAMPAVFTQTRSMAAEITIDDFSKAKIDWKQFKGEEITVVVIPADYFENLIQITNVFRELTGIRVRYERIPPTLIRHKVILDLASYAGNYATHAADPMYYPLYVTNKWVDSLDGYLNDTSITDAAWYDYNDILEGWRDATSIDGIPYGIPFDGEATIQIYRKDVFAKAGIQPAETLEVFAANAGKIHDPNNQLWGAALRGFRGAGQNMYIFPSIFRAFGGEWFDSNGKLVVTTEPAIEALKWYSGLLKSYAPPDIINWNWPQIANAFSQGTVGMYIDAHSTAGVINNPTSSKVIGKIGFARWPKGPSGKRVTSIWNWSFPINAALPERKKKATWLFIQWATSKGVQKATAHKFAGPYKRTGVNRTSIWQDPEYRKSLDRYGDNLAETITTTFRDDIDLEWRPRVPQWPQIGDIMGTAVRSTLNGKATPKKALADAQIRIDHVMRS